jgi:hypothetical protein
MSSLAFSRETPARPDMASFRGVVLEGEMPFIQYVDIISGNNMSVSSSFATSATTPSEFLFIVSSTLALQKILVSAGYLWFDETWALDRYGGWNEFIERWNDEVLNIPERNSNNPQRFMFTIFQFLDLAKQSLTVLEQPIFLAYSRCDEE